MSRQKDKYGSVDGDVVRITNQQCILDILLCFDHVFTPHLSERINELNDYANKLYKHAYVYAVKNGDTFNGFVVFYANNIDSRESFLAQIAVMPNNHKKGIGSTLLELFHETSKMYGMEISRLEVDMNNESAIKFYQRHGYAYCGTASVDSIYMTKRLVLR